MKLVTVDQMRRIEAASDAQGHTYAAMMDRAGSAVARVHPNPIGRARQKNSDAGWAGQQRRRWSGRGALLARCGRARSACIC